MVVSEEEEVSSAALPISMPSSHDEAACPPPPPKKTKKEDPRPYKCRVDVCFPTSIDAKRAVDVLSVDDEIGDKTSRSFELLSPEMTASIPTSASGTTFTSDDSPTPRTVMRVMFEAAEARLLRVSLSTFYDLLNVVLKCYREFGVDDKKEDDVDDVDDAENDNDGKDGGMDDGDAPKEDA